MKMVDELGYDVELRQPSEAGADRDLEEKTNAMPILWERNGKRDSFR